MADIVKYTDMALKFGTVSVPYVAGSLAVGNREVRDVLKSGGVLRPDLIQIIRKRPVISATLLDPSLVTAWAEYGAGKTITSVSAHWLAYASNGGLGTGAISLTSAQGIVVPVSLSASQQQAATLQVEAHCLYATGTGLVLGTTAGAAAGVTKAYYPTSLTINDGSSEAITELVDVSVNWEYDIQDDDQLEPAYLYYPLATVRGTARLKKLASLTVVRLEDLDIATVTLLLTDANNGANTVSVAVGSCLVKVEASGEDANLTFERVGS